jgi:hypothetical protein
VKKYSTEKRMTTALLLVGVLLSAGASFGAGPKYTLAVRDKVESDQDENETEKGNTFITVITDTEVCTLKVKVKLRGLPSRDCQLEWAFISEKMANVNADEEVVISNFGKKSISLQDNVELEEIITSGPFVSTETQTETSKNSKIKTSTHTSEGYIVLLTADGEILASNASSSKYLKDEWVDQVRNAKSSSGGKKKKKKK